MPTQAHQLPFGRSPTSPQTGEMMDGSGMEVGGSAPAKSHLTGTTRISRRRTKRSAHLTRPSQQRTSTSITPGDLLRSPAGDRGSVRREGPHTDKYMRCPRGTHSVRTSKIWQAHTRWAPYGPLRENKKRSERKACVSRMASPLVCVCARTAHKGRGRSFSCSPSAPE